MIRYGKYTKLVEVDGVKYPAQYVGSGTFSTVYRVGDRVIYYTKGDCTKEVLSMFNYERVTHLPEIVRHDDIIRYGRSGEIVDYWYVFSSPYYRNIKKKDVSAWRMMTALMSSYDDFLLKYSRNNKKEPKLFIMMKFIDYLNEVKTVPYSIIRALEVIVDIVSNCGVKVSFDFYIRNFGVNEYGTLIFRDIIYSYE